MRSIVRSVGVLVFLLPVGLLAQAHEHSGQHERRSEHADGRSEIAALTAEEVLQLRAGEGMGLARAAELNSYPGPKHLLELATELELSEEQRQRVERIRDRMLKDAVELGEQVVAAESALDERFRARDVNAELLDRHLREIAGLRARLRGVHLVAHLESTRLLSGQQVARYDELRGYR